MNHFHVMGSLMDDIRYRLALTSIEDGGTDPAYLLPPEIFHKVLRAG